MGHDIITIGASAGGIDVLVDVVRKLPATLPASLFVALHSAPFHPSQLPEILNQSGRLVASHPLHGERIEPGHIYIAPPDNQLYVRQGSMEIVRGPREMGIGRRLREPPSATRMDSPEMADPEARSDYPLLLPLR